MRNFDVFLDKLLALHDEHDDWSAPGGYKLGDYSRKDSRATLYNVEHSASSHERLRRELDSTGVRYRMIVEPPHPGDTSSNVLLLDIDI